MSTILGLDLSLTSTGWCVLVDGEIEKKGTIKTKEKGIRRILTIRREIISNCFHFIKLAVVEGYSMGSRTGQAFSIGELGGLIKVSLFSNYIKTLIVAPTSLKKFVTGKGNAPKDMMMMKVLAKYGIEFTDNNICDAFCLAKMGQAYLEGTDIKYEQEALKKVEVLK